MVAAIIRLARNRCSSRLIVWSSVDTWYQQGLVLQAATVVRPPGSGSAAGTWTECSARGHPPHRLPASWGQNFLRSASRVTSFSSIDSAS